MKQFLNVVLFCLVSVSFASGQSEDVRLSFKDKASIALDSIYKHYGVKDQFLLRENYPFDESYQASYLAGPDQAHRGNAYSYLWPFSGSLSAQVARFEIDQDPTVLKEIRTKVLPGLANYFDTREPVGYASYINSAKQSDRFYDDNVWLGIDFSDLYLQTKDKAYLAKAEEIWQFVESGKDDKLGGGIYWCEQKKESKNTCSNAPGVVFLLKLYQGTKNKVYLEKAISLYDWTKSNLQDGQDHLYFDNISLTGKIGRAKYPYNSGQMLQSAALLYTLTKESKYLKDAQEIAASAHDYFFHKKSLHDGVQFKLLKNSDAWFIAVMLRGFAELYHIDKNPVYIDSFKENLSYAWSNLKDEQGLFNKDWTGQKKSDKKWLLDQLAMVEMYARLASL